MRLDRARTTALLAAAVLTAAGWVAAAPAAYADPVDTCITKSDTYRDFKECYATMKSEADKADAEAKKDAEAKEKADEKRCEDRGGIWHGGAKSCETGE